MRSGAMSWILLQRLHPTCQGSSLPTSPRGTSYPYPSCPLLSGDLTQPTMPFFLKCFSHFKFVDHTSLASPHLSGHSFFVSFTGSSFSSTKPFLGAAHGSAFSLLLLFICTRSYGFKHQLHANNSLLQPQPRSLLPCSMSPRGCPLSLLWMINNNMESLMSKDLEWIQEAIRDVKLTSTLDATESFDSAFLSPLELFFFFLIYSLEITA